MIYYLSELLVYILTQFLSSSSLKPPSSLLPKLPNSSQSPKNLIFPNFTQKTLSTFPPSKTLKTSKNTHQTFLTKTHSTSSSSSSFPPTDESQPSNVQELHVYEINELDRGSPVYLPLSKKWAHSLGDVVPFTNKLYTGDLGTRLGITAGLCLLIQNVPLKFGDRYEVIYTFYFGDYGSVTVRGAYLTHSRQDTWLAITGGTGVFEGAYGHVRLHQVVYPFKIMYRFRLKGIRVLPQELVGGKTVKPRFWVGASKDARACEDHAVAPNFTN